MDWNADTAMPWVGRGLFGRLRAASSTEWTAYTRHAFVRGLADGSLPAAQFRRFLVQDYQYLLQYARAYGLAIYKSDTLEDMQAAAATVWGLLQDEMSLHLAFCGEWGLDADAIRAEPASMELLAYSGFMLDRAQAGDLLDLLSVLSACLVGYAEVGARLMADPATRRDGNPYFAWIETYSGETYLQLAQAGVDRLNRLGETRGGDGRFDRLLTDFRTAVRLEAAFWSGAMAPAAANGQ